MATDNGILSGIGVGAAQVFGKSGLASSERERQARESAKAQEEKDRRRKNLELYEYREPGTVFPQDVDDYMNYENDISNLYVDYTMGGLDLTSPATIEEQQAYRNIQEKQAQQIARDKKNIADKAFYDKAMQGINKGTSIFEPEQSYDVLEAWGKLSSDERRKQGYPKLPLRKEFDDPNKYLTNVPDAKFRTIIEDGAETIKRSGASKDLMQELWVNFNETPYGQNFAPQFFDGDIDKAEDFFYSHLKGRAGTEYSRTEDEGRGASNKGYDNLRNPEWVDAEQAEYGSYKDEDGAIVATKGQILPIPKFVSKVALSDKKGRREFDYDVEGFGYDSEGNKYIMASYNDGKDNIEVTQIPATKENVAAIKNSINDKDQLEAFNEFNKKWDEGVKDLETGTVDKDKLEGVQLAIESSFEDLDLSKVNDEEMTEIIKDVMSSIYSKEELDEIGIEADLAKRPFGISLSDDEITINDKSFDVVNGKIVNPKKFAEEIFNATKSKFTKFSNKTKDRLNKLPD